MNKADHNLKFSESIHKEFNDWIIVVLYFSLYHACLALVVNKGQNSKSHIQTLNFIKENYSEISEKELNLINNLFLTKEDIEFYTQLKKDRQNANYTTNTGFKNEKTNYLREETTKLIDKIKIILNQE